jgi:hypothetical protein
MSWFSRLSASSRVADAGNDRRAESELVKPLVNALRQFTIQGVNVEVTEEIVPGANPPTPSILLRADPGHTLSGPVLLLICNRIEKSDLTFPLPIKSESARCFNFTLSSSFRYGKSGEVVDYHRICEMCDELAAEPNHPELTEFAAMSADRESRMSPIAEQAHQQLGQLLPAIAQWQQENEVPTAVVEKLKRALLVHLPLRKSK